MWLSLYLAAWLTAGETPPPLRGVLIDRQGDAQAGQISVRAADFFVHVFLCDPRTEIWREGRVAGWLALREGDTVEVRCAAAAAPRCRADSIRVVAPAPAARSSAGLPRWTPPNWNSIPFPRGNLLLAGTIVEVHPDHLRLRLRGGGRRLVRLREDTRYLADGLPAERPELRVNMHVFVRAGRSLDGDVEAFQVVWGSILPAR